MGEGAASRTRRSRVSSARGAKAPAAGASARLCSWSSVGVIEISTAEENGRRALGEDGGGPFHTRRAGECPRAHTRRNRARGIIKRARPLRQAARRKASGGRRKR